MTGETGNPVPVDAAGGVVYKKAAGKLYVLMIYRRGHWDLPKGKQDEGETPEVCAIREVAEETGSKPPEITGFLDETVHTYTDEWGHFIKTTRWYAMKTGAKKFTPQKSEDITKVCWVPLSDAIRLAAFDNLKQVLKVFRDQFKE